jgi:hypothetical protein
MKRAIRFVFSDSNTVASALGVYAAFAEIASNNESEVFVATHKHIETLSGFGNSAVKLRIADLEAHKFIWGSPPTGLKAPRTYKMLAYSGQPLRDSHPVTYDSHPVTYDSHQPDFGPVTALEEQEEQRKKKNLTLLRESPSRGVQGGLAGTQNKIVVLAASGSYVPGEPGKKTMDQWQGELFDRLLAIHPKGQYDGALSHALQNDPEKFERVLDETERKLNDPGEDPIRNVGGFITECLKRFKSHKNGPGRPSHG